jgi:hypothetical protein
MTREGLLLRLAGPEPARRNLEQISNQWDSALDPLRALVEPAER